MRTKGTEVGIAAAVLGGFLAVVVAVGVGVLAGFLVSLAQADWRKVAAEWDQYRLNDTQMQWFKSIKAPNGVPCCDMADGHPTEMQRCLNGHSQTPGKREICGTEDGIYIPDPIHLDEPRQWIKVPDWAVVKNAVNPIGVATVWWVLQSGDTVYIRCFVAESET